MGRRALQVLVLAGLVGCSSSTSVELRTWQLSIDGREGTRSVGLPTHFDDGRIPDERLVYRLRTTTRVPPGWHGEPLQLVLPDLAAIVALRVDGVEALLVSPSSTGYRRRGPHTWLIPADAASDGSLELELVIEHTWTQSAWWGTVPRILPYEASDPAATAVRTFNLFASAAAIVALLEIGLASLVIYMSDRRRRVYLPFAFQGILAGFYPLFVAGWTQHVFGVYDVPVLGVTLAAACIASIYFTHDFFGLQRPSRAFVGVGALASLITVLASNPFRTTRIGGIATIAFVSIVMIYQIRTCARLLRRGPDRKSALYSLLSWLVLVVTGMPDFHWWLGLGDLVGGVRLASIGFTLFAVFLSLLLSQKHVLSLKKSDSLNTELEGRVAQLELRRSEIELLNEELRRQIADRASQIYSAVALASTHDVTASLADGEIVQGRYRAERPLGSGGMGTIYEVTRLSDGRKLALKVPREIHGKSLARLAREAQIASTLSHPNIVAIVDVDVASAGYLYLVMELVEGTSLDQHRERFGDISWALPVLQQIAEGLAALHGVGIVHRDLKPANVLVVTSTDVAPCVKIADFGISVHPESEHESDHGDDEGAAAPVDEPSDDAVTQQRVDEASGPSTAIMPVRGKPKLAANGPQPPKVATSSFLTRTGHIPGTPAYMAPELAQGRTQLSSAADVFAFGVIAHELLTGRRAFSEVPFFALLEKRGLPSPTPMLVAWPSCPVELARALDACLAVSPRERPTARELAHLLTTISAR